MPMRRLSSTMSVLNRFILLALLGVASAYPIALRIVNGTRADAGEFPFVVSLRRAQSGSHFCGGTILSSSWVLTAAHCVAGSRPQSINIQYGTTSITRNSLNVANVSEIVVYPGYLLPVVLHDIALLRLQEPLVLDQSVQVITLPRMYQLTEENVPAKLIGWGFNETGGRLQKDLQKVEIKIYSREECSRRHILFIQPTNICAGIEGGGKGQCNGDSGGPLIVNGRQVGISSWSMKPCTIAPYPGVYTEVSNYVDWIRWVMEYDVDE